MVLVCRHYMIHSENSRRWFREDVGLEGIIKFASAAPINIMMRWDGVFHCGDKPSCLNLTGGKMCCNSTAS